MSNILDFIYPRRCPICDEIIIEKTKKMCTSCAKKLIYVGKLQCNRCGKTVEQPEIEYCFDCSKGNNSYEKGYPVFEYNEAIKKSIFKYKYGNRREYAIFYSNEIWNRYGQQMRQEKFDLVIPVPLSKKRMHKRGFNQAELIAVRIANYLNIKLDTNSLKRIKDTKPQKVLSSSQRQKNIKNAFHVCDNSVELKKILLVDDIYTTGSTVNTCSHKLMEKGALSVHYVSVAIGKGM